MKTLPYFEVNAFSGKSFKGNPAGVCLLDNWLTDEEMQAIAEQNNLAETAFVVKLNRQRYGVRWFTPVSEIDLCGHATLGAAHVVANSSSEQPDSLIFEYPGGELPLSRNKDIYELNFPARHGEEFTDFSVFDSLGISPGRAVLSRDLVAVLNSEEEVRNFEPDFSRIKALPGLGFVITSKGKNFDIVSRCFFPKIAIPEDPVTGSAHCTLAPLWADILGKKELFAYQASPRGGELQCIVQGDRVLLRGKANTYLRGEVLLAKD